MQTKRPQTSKRQESQKKEIKMDCRERYKRMVQYKSEAQLNNKLKTLTEPDLQYQTTDEIEKKFEEFGQDFQELNVQPIRYVKRREGRLDLKNNPYNNKRVSNIRKTLVARNQQEFQQISEEFQKKLLPLNQQPTLKQRVSTQNNIQSMSNISDTDQIQHLELLKQSAKRLQNKSYKNFKKNSSQEKKQKEKEEKMQKLKEKQEKLEKKINKSNLWVQTHDNIMNNIRNQDNQLLKEQKNSQNQHINIHNNNSSIFLNVQHQHQNQNQNKSQINNNYSVFNNNNYNNQNFRLDDNTQMDLFASHTVSVLFQALMVKQMEQTFGVKYNIDSGVPISEAILKNFGINISFLKSIKSEKERKNYIQETMNARIDIMLKEWNQDIQYREKQYALQEKERQRKQETIEEEDQDFFKWLNVKTKQESLKKKLRSEIIKRMTDYENYVVLVEKYKQKAKCNKISNAQIQKSLYLEGVPFTSTRTVISELNKVEGNILDKWEARKRKHLEYKKKNFYSQNKKQNQEQKSHEQQEVVEKHQFNLEDESQDQQQNDQKKITKIEWNEELENQFVNQKKQVQSLYYEDIMSTDWQELAYIPFVQQNNLDSHNQAKREILMEKYREGNILTSQELKFMADTSKLLNSCLDKDFLKESLKLIEPDCIHYMELDLAERIINNYQEMKQNIINARKSFLKEKIKQVYKKNQDTVQKWEKQKIKEQNIQEYKKKSRLMNYEIQRIQKERPILFAYYHNFFFKLAVNIFKDQVKRIRKKFLDQYYKLKEQGIIQENYSNPYKTNTLSNSEINEQQKEKMKQLSRHFQLKEEREKKEAIIHKLHPPSKLPFYPKKDDGEMEDYYQMRIKTKVEYMEQKIEEFKLKSNSNESSKNQLYFSKYISGGPITPKGSKFENNEDFKQLTKEDKQKLEQLITNYKSYKMRYIVKQKKERHNNQGYRECTKRLNLLKQHKYLERAQANYNLKREQQQQNFHSELNNVGSIKSTERQYLNSNQKIQNYDTSAQQEYQIKPNYLINTSVSMDKFQKTADTKQKFETEGDIIEDVQCSYLNLAKNSPREQNGKVQQLVKPKLLQSKTYSNQNLKTNSSYFLTPKNKPTKQQNFSQIKPSSGNSRTEKYQNLIQQISKEEQIIKKEFFLSKKNPLYNSENLIGNTKQKKLQEYKSPGQIFQRLKLKHTCLFNAVKRSQLYLMQNSRFEYNRDDVRQFDDKQCTPLHYAVKNQDIDFCEWLLKKGADPNQKTQNNNTPLHIAFKENNLFIIGMLIDHGGDLNLLNQDGFTPCGMGSIETLTRLNLVEAVIMGKNQENFDNNRLLKVKPFEEIKEQRLHIKKFYPLQKNEYREDQVDTIKIEEYISI